MLLFEVLKKCHLGNLSKWCPRLCPSAYPRGKKWINGIISKIPHTNEKILFVYGSFESLERLEGKIGEAPFYKVQFGKVTV